MNSYDYTPLTSGSSEIRLITLLPGSWDTTIECSIHHDLLDTKPAYDALSYTWGDPKLTRQIVLNGTRFNATANLETALRYLRLDNRTRTLWVDAICIDQSNLLERSEQVRRMRDIYTYATKVIAWTGEADEDSDRAMALMRETSNLIASSPEEKEFSINAESLQELGFDLSSKSWSALITFWQRPYWSRMWVVQELSSAGDLFETSENRCIIRCGPTEIGFCQFTDMCIFLGMVRDSSANFISNATRVEEPLRTMIDGGIIAASQMFGVLLMCTGDESDDFPVTDIMYGTKDFQASDCRDKLYAVLGLTREADMAIVPDYSKSPAQVYIELIRFLINHDRNLKSLGGNRMGTNKFGPSWIPELYGSMLSGPAWANERRTYRVSGKIEADVSFDPTQSLLHVQGTLLGILSNVIGPFAQKVEPVAGPIFDVYELYKVRGLDVLFGTLDTFSETLDTSQHELFWRTLVMDADFTDWDNVIIPAPETFGMMWKSVVGLTAIPETFEPDLPDFERGFRFCRPWGGNMEQCLLNRCFFTTECGRMGIGPYRSQPGDVVVMLYGGDFPFVLRPKNDQYEIIGDAYVHGIMRGELCGGLDGDQMWDSQNFTLC